MSRNTEVREDHGVVLGESTTGGGGKDEEGERTADCRKAEPEPTG